MSLMMGDSLRSYASLGRLNLKVPEFTDGLSREEETPVIQRKSSVRFLDQVTTINDDGETGDQTTGGEVTPLRDEAANHKCSFVVGDSYGYRGMEGGKKAPSQRELSADVASSLRTDRRDREARMEQNIEWIRDEIAKLKQQDQSLMRQFLQLRSVIYQLKGTVTTGQRPVAKLPRIAASVESFSRYESNAEGLDSTVNNDMFLAYEDGDDLCELDDQMALMEDPYLPEFRGRTVSLLNPGNLPRTRVDSGGFGYLKSRTMSFSVGTSARELDRAIVE
ncbi:uncharacterized protein LOC119744590 [Patiria miniata]|uniref:Uncharacterized protein n=1 Tax=Patiria miniata TaxID=46514 RepID=A0A914BK90_PATMI|nr:uncharacterized protein LOC119744590 [Patiria miniata]